MRSITGALFLWDREPHITGYLTINGDHFEIKGTRKSNIRIDFEGRIPAPTPQADLFDDPGGGGG
jgi:hypothetical protein